MDGDADDRRRGVASLQLVVSAAAVLVGLWLLVEADRAGWFVAAVTAIAAGAVGLARQLTGPGNGAARPEAGQCDGLPAMVVRRSRRGHVLALVELLLVGLGVAGLAFLALTGGRSDWAVLLGIVALALFLPAILGVMGRYVAGTLALTSETIVYRSAGLSWRVPWAAVDEVRVDGRNTVVLVPREHGEQSIEHRYVAGPYYGERSSARAAAIHVPGLALTTRGLATVLDYFLHHSDARRELGTSAGLTIVDSVSRGRIVS